MTSPPAFRPRGPNGPPPADSAGGGVSAILLAAGYGTRLYPVTKDCPKALLPLGPGVVLDWILAGVQGVPGLSRVVLVTNHRFVQQFDAWSQQRHVPLDVVDDGTSTPESRLGAIRDLLLGLTRVEPHDDVLVLGTDNLFAWSLADFVAFAAAKRPAMTVALRTVRSPQDASRCAVVELDPQGRLLRCIEKPASPFSLTVGLCVYYIPASCRGRLEEFVTCGGDVDAPGYFAEWLVKQEAVYGFMTAGEWFDIGSHETYQHAVQWWSHLPSLPVYHTAAGRTTRQTP